MSEEVIGHFEEIKAVLDCSPHNRLLRASAFAVMFVLALKDGSGDVFFWSDDVSMMSAAGGTSDWLEGGQCFRPL